MWKFSPNGCPLSNTYVPALNLTQGPAGCADINISTGASITTQSSNAASMLQATPGLEALISKRSRVVTVDPSPTRPRSGLVNHVSQFLREGCSIVRKSALLYVTLAHLLVLLRFMFRSRGKSVCWVTEHLPYTCKSMHYDSNYWVSSC